MQNYKRFFICLLFTLLTHGHGAEAEEYSSGADYLQNAIRDIVIKNSEQSIFNLIDNQARIATAPPARRLTPSSLLFDSNRRFSGGEHQLPQPHPQTDSYHPDYLTPPGHDSHHDYQHDSHPPTAPSGHGGIPSPPSLTKGELAALYEAAVSAGHGIQFNSPSGLQDSLPGQAALHEVHDTSLQHQHHHTSQGDATEGYYYYYYPLKSFMDGGHAHKVPKDHYQTPVLTSYNTHLHNVKVEPIHTIAPAPKGKGLQPLFMAISSFVGMAVMFAFSMVLWPRFSGGLKGAIKPGKGGKGKIVPGKGKIVPGKGGGKNNIKKKPRFLEDLNVNWSSLIRSWMDAYACKTCKNYRRLEPYRSALSRTERTRSKK